MEASIWLVVLYQSLWYPQHRNGVNTRYRTRARNHIHNSTGIVDMSWESSSSTPVIGLAFPREAITPAVGASD